jgi:exonuclease III
LTICCLQEAHLTERNKHYLRVKGWKTYEANGIWKQSGVTTFTPHKVDFKSKLVRRDKEGHFILIKGWIHQEEITIINLFVSDVGAPNLIKHILTDLKLQINPNLVVVGDFNTPLSPIDRSSRQKSQQRNSRNEWHHDQLELTDVYRVFQPTIHYTFFSAAHEIFYEIDHILGHKTSLNKYKKTEIIPSILSDHNAIKLELNNKRISRKYSNNWRLNTTLLNDHWVIEEIREEIKIPRI